MNLQPFHHCYRSSANSASQSVLCPLQHTFEFSLSPEECIVIKQASITKMEVSNPKANSVISKNKHLLSLNNWNTTFQKKKKTFEETQRAFQGDFSQTIRNHIKKKGRRVNRTYFHLQKEELNIRQGNLTSKSCSSDLLVYFNLIFFHLISTHKNMHFVSVSFIFLPSLLFELLYQNHNNMIKQKHKQQRDKKNPQTQK